MTPQAGQPSLSRLLIRIVRRRRLPPGRNVVEIIDHYFGCPEDSRLGNGLIARRKPELPRPLVSLDHLNTAYPEGRVFRGLTLDACDGKVFGVNPDPAANEELVSRLGIDFQNIAAVSIEDVGADQTEIVIGGNDARVLALPFFAGFVFRVYHLAEDVIAHKPGPSFGDHFKRLHAGVIARDPGSQFGAFIGFLVLEAITPNACIPGEGRAPIV